MFFFHYNVQYFSREGKKKTFNLNEAKSASSFADRLGDSSWQQLPLFAHSESQERQCADPGPS